MIRDAQQHNENATPKDFEIDVLMEALPHYFDGDGNFKLEKFQNMLQEEQVELSRESYELNFLGKSYARLLASLETETVIVPNEEHNADERNADSENIYITGDNLDALKHLAKSYRGKVKCIYIDPPYNTGSDDFAYNDTFNFKIDDLVEQIGVTEQEAERILDLQGKSSHSAWLTFMLPRLVLGRQLLTDDGVICMSIDENEFSNLQQLGNEIFGEENFAGTLIWKNSSKNDESYVSTQHEYVLVWARSKAINNGEWLEKKQGLPEIYAQGERLKKQHGDDWDSIHKGLLKFFRELSDSNPIKDSKHYNWMDERGIYHAGNISGPNYGQYRYDVLHPVAGKVVKEPSSGWRFPEEKMKQRIEENLIVFGRDETTVPKNKVYLKDSEYQSLTSMIYKDGRAATNSLKNLLGGDYFSNPKNPGVLARLFRAIGVSAGDIVVDFFSGSGSTAEAVMQMNAENNTNIKYVLVQLQEKLDPKSKAKTVKNAIAAGYETVDQIGRDRIVAAADKIKKDTGADIDYGFKHYTLETPPQSVIDSLEDFAPDDNLFSDDPLEALDFDGTSAKNVLLTTWIVQDGYGLNPEVEKVTLQNYELTVVGNTAYAIDGGMSSDDIRVLTQKLEDGEIDITNFVYFHTAIGFERLRELDSALRHLRNRSSVTITARW